jgi:hypothetical protein
MRGRTVHRESGRKETRGRRKEKRGRKKREGRKVKRGGRNEKRGGRMDKRTPLSTPSVVVQRLGVANIQS